MIMAIKTKTDSNVKRNVMASEMFGLWNTFQTMLSLMDSFPLNGLVYS